MRGIIGRIQLTIKKVLLLFYAVFIILLALLLLLIHPITWLLTGSSFNDIANYVDTILDPVGEYLEKEDKGYIEKEKEEEECTQIWIIKE